MSRLRTYHAIVTFENPDSLDNPPRTTRLDVSATTVLGAFKQAFRAAKRQYPSARWDSMLVILEKAEKTDEPESDDADVAETE